MKLREKKEKQLMQKENDAGSRTDIDDKEIVCIRKETSASNKTVCEHAHGHPLAHRGGGKGCIFLSITDGGIHAFRNIRISQCAAIHFKSLLTSENMHEKEYTKIDGDVRRYLILGK